MKTGLPHSDNISGIVLAGGRARRMGGHDKGWIDYRGRPLVEHAIAGLADQVDDIIIVANRNTARYRSLGHAVVTDAVPGFLGPLAGFHAGLAAAPGGHALCVPCDAPSLPADLASRMLRALLDSDAELAVAHDGDRLQPLFCLLSRPLEAPLSDALAAARLRTDRWLTSRRHVIVDFSDAPEAFMNINTPEALQSAARLSNDHDTGASRAY